VNSLDFGSTKCAENRSPEAKRLPIGQMLFHLNVQSLTRSAPPHTRSASSHNRITNDVQFNLSP
jgi:hypothetical protein